MGLVDGFVVGSGGAVLPVGVPWGLTTAAVGAGPMRFLWKWLANRFRVMARTRKMPKTTEVAQVRTSPVLEPKAVLPPAPPKAEASPPPRPFWMSTRRIMKRQTM